ncbi:MaoC family dehydratase [Alsobacter sp. R-9]
MSETAFRRYEDVAVGDAFPERPLAFAVTAERVEAFLAATGHRRPAGDGQAPSMIASVYLIDLLTARRSPPGGIHAKQSLRFHRPVRIGEVLSIQARVTDKYVRKERPYVVSDFEARGEDGSLVSTGRVTSIWGRDP